MTPPPRPAVDGISVFDVEPEGVPGEVVVPPEVKAAVDLLVHYGRSAKRRPSVHLTDGHVLWLVVSGSFDLFAVDRVGQRPWQLIGRLHQGMILAGSPSTSRIVLVARTADEGMMRLLPMEELSQLQHAHWRTAHPGDRHPAQTALVSGVDLGLAVIHNFLRTTPPPHDAVELDAGHVEPAPGCPAVAPDGLRWVQVRRGRLSVASRDDQEYVAGQSFTLATGDWTTSSTTVSLHVRTTGELLTQARLWPELIAEQTAVLAALDRALDARDRRAAQEVRRGRAASNDAMADAEDLLDAVAVPTDDPELVRARTEAPLIAACRLVAHDVGIDLRDFPPLDPSAAPIDPVERLATAGGFRTRPVVLTGQWWRDDIGPLLGRRTGGAPVALLWRAGRYRLHDPANGTDERVDAGNAGTLDGRAVMFYRRLPDGPPTLRALLRFGLQGSRRDGLRILLGALLALGVGLIVPILTGQVLGVYVAAGQRDLIVLACLALTVGALASAAFTVVPAMGLIRVEGRMEAGLQAAVWDRLLRLPVGFFRRWSTGEVASSALAVSAIRQIVSTVGTTVVVMTVQGVLSTALLFWYSRPLGLLALGIVLLHASVFVLVARRQLPLQRQLVPLKYALSNTVFHFLRGVPKLRVAAAENFAYQRWATDFARSRELVRRIRRNQATVVVINAAYQPVSTLVLFAVLTGPARGTLSVAGYLTFYSAFGAALAAFAQVSSSLSSAIAIVPMYDRLRPTLEEDFEVGDGALPGRLTGRIALENVSFRYHPDGPLILDDITLQIDAGEFVAVVGHTGSGKSTLLRLLLGFETPSAGVVTYDRHDLADLDVRAVRSQCGVVLQDSAPFAGTVLDNIRGSGDHSLDEVWEAARLAGLEDDIRAMPMGLHTVVSAGGGLSGGQRQRLVIAQALIRRPRILYLDEATSALDNDNQQRVTESAQNLRGTRVVIAHRLSTVLDADRVVVLVDGRIVQDGSPKELLADADGAFSRLARRQQLAE